MPLWDYVIGGNITFNEQGKGDHYGNDVTQRSAYLPTSANRSWIDIDRPLPGGFIERFYIYVHNVPSLDPQSQRIRLQVWRPVDVTLRQYMLVWSQLIQVYITGALYSVCSYRILFLNTERMTGRIIYISRPRLKNRFKIGY